MNNYNEKVVLLSAKYNGNGDIAIVYVQNDGEYYYLGLLANGNHERMKIPKEMADYLYEQRDSKYTHR